MENGVLKLSRCHPQSTSSHPAARSKCFGWGCAHEPAGLRWAPCSVSPARPCPFRNEVTKMKFEGKTFYLYVSQKEVSALLSLGTS